MRERFSGAWVCFMSSESAPACPCTCTRQDFACQLCLLVLCISCPSSVYTLSCVHSGCARLVTEAALRARVGAVVIGRILDRGRTVGFSCATFRQPLVQTLIVGWTLMHAPGFSNMLSRICCRCDRGGTPLRAARTGGSRSRWAQASWWCCREFPYLAEGNACRRAEGTAMCNFNDCLLDGRRIVFDVVESSDGFKL